MRLPVLFQIHRLVPHCSGLLGRTSLRQHGFTKILPRPIRLFRPSRPDFIETSNFGGACTGTCHCSGLLGRTSLRRNGPCTIPTICRKLFRPSRPDFIETYTQRASHPTTGMILFRPSRPDFIETLLEPIRLGQNTHCSGLLGRTSLRRKPTPRASYALPCIVPAF